ncbi:hypothetical protein KDU71_04380 [Carboxylicivirga sediminis]|uniref:Uncharacterized protein n=1 Tax=Carboxylicivirga sediminis TaxID=2006564 RepID=A0A941F0R9_9BACT|nr:hypothetical protein [Carboxylicivirga sediminis]MBR8534786.1 hypothetical protein [Carboxylicivirga sediminis]
MKYWLLLFISFYTLLSNATNWWYQGYVITNDDEKIYGEIYVPPHSQTTGALVISGIDLEGFYNRVWFKHDGSESDYVPEMIREFGFTYMGSDYKFESTCLHFKSIVKSERTKHRFLNVVHRGNISLLRDCRMFQDGVAGRSGYPEYLTYYDYYLSSSDGKLIRLFSSNETEDLKMVLEQLGMDKRFLYSIGRIKVRTLADVLYQYDVWLSEQKKPVQVVI